MVVRRNRFGTNNAALDTNVRDWFTIVGMNDAECGVVCQLWVLDVFGADKLTALKINVFETCILGLCMCVHYIGGVRAQLKP